MERDLNRPPQVGTSKISLDIQDTGGSYVGDFPAMVKCSLASADAVLLVYSVACLDSFDYLSGLRDLVQQERGEGMPVVVVGNKTDLERQIPREEAEATVLCDWENGYVECSAMFNTNVNMVFRELLQEARSGLLPLQSGAGLLVPGPPGHSSLNLRRRQSLPVVPVFNKGDTLGLAMVKRREARRGSVAATQLAKQSCKIS